MAEKESDGFVGAVRKMLPFTSALLIIALLYVGWIFFSRRREANEYQQQRQQKEAEAARASVDAYGGDRVKILALTLSEGTIKRGKSAQLCYGVSNAKTVKIDPLPEGDVWPSMSRCLDVSPTKDTVYSLTAQDAAGHVENAQVQLFVK